MRERNLDVHPSVAVAVVGLGGGRVQRVGGGWDVSLYGLSSLVPQRKELAMKRCATALGGADLQEALLGGDGTRAPPAERGRLRS
eukprot:2577941-Rhodomonas_salina.2